jgi:flagellin
MQVINTNVMSLNAQRNLNSSQSSLATSIQRLSSGLRINSAKDDAAGLAIASRFTTQIRGLDQAARNANDAISLAQTAEGAMGEISNNLQRIRELAIQSRNATNSASDRTALQAEVAQLKSEIQRVAEQTTFNGLSLLDGTFTSQSFQVGANQGDIISVNAIVNTQISALGSWTSLASVDGAAPVGSGATAATAGSYALADVSAGYADFSTNNVSFDVDGNTITLDGDYSAFTSSDSLATVIQTKLDAAAGAGVYTVTGNASGNDLTIAKVATGAASTAPVVDNYVQGASAVADFVSGGTSTDGAAAVAASFNAGNFVLNGETISVAAAADAATRLTNMVDAINASDAGVTASVVSGALHLVSNDSSDIVIAAGTFAGNLTGETGLSAATTSGTATVGFASLTIATTEGADNAILAMDAALASVNSGRADLGAIQNRFTSVVANLQTTSENLTASRSRILDADFAKETAELTRTQILQQAGTAMLAQANSAPQNVLSLLRG